MGAKEGVVGFQRGIVILQGGEECLMRIGSEAGVSQVGAVASLSYVA